MSALERLLFADDGRVPNNPRIALRLYRAALPVLDDDAERAVIRLFARHGWGGAWVNGIYPFQHYHATAHEVLGIAAGFARVQFGGATGPVLRIEAGDGVMIPAGVGHCAIECSTGLSVVGAYPRGQEQVDLKRATPAEHAQALRQIPRVALPERDPVTGRAFSSDEEAAR
jgi:uncharacterized protein YjlB